MFPRIASLVDVRAKGTVRGLAVGTKQGINFLDRAAVAVDDLPHMGDLSGGEGRAGPNFTPRALVAWRPLRMRSMMSGRLTQPGRRTRSGPNKAQERSKT
ncbi:hypothetical protein HF563_01905 [Acidithiobacillus ferridurans]|nr:hypothetical protein [Acidithiobacillus ferridurans]